MTLKNAVVRLDVAISDTVGSVLAKVADKAGISPDEQMLTYDKKPMDDRKILSDYGFKAHYKYIIRLAKKRYNIAYNICVEDDIQSKKV